jgi:conserved oligomeric Golgi complex subunit 5
MMETYRHIVDPLLAAIKSDSGAIIAKLHRDPIRSTDALADMGGSSAYIKEITEKLAFVKSEILARLSIEEVTREWFVFLRIREFRGKIVFLPVAGRWTS